MPSRSPDGSVAMPAGTSGGTAISGKLSEKHTTRLSAGIAVRNSRFTETGTGSIAAMPAILLTGSMGVAAMTKEEFRNEKLYQATMHIARKMLKQGAISEEEYNEIDAVFLKKYRPVLGQIFSHI